MVLHSKIFFVFFLVAACSFPAMSQQDTAKIPGQGGDEFINDEYPIEPEFQQQNVQTKPADTTTETSRQYYIPVGGNDTAQQNSGSVDTTLTATDKNWISAFVAYKGMDSSESFLNIIANPMFSVENSIVIEIGENIYLQSKTTFVRYIVGGAGFTGGILLPIKVPQVLVYFHAKASFHRAVPNGETEVMTYITATNELRVGKSILIKNIPFEYIPIVGGGYNNGVIVVRWPDGKLRGWDTHYFWHYMLGLEVRQPFVIKTRLYTLGLCMSYEQALIDDEDTKKRLDFSLLLGL
jgi:hypothetical protein